MNLIKKYKLHLSLILGILVLSLLFIPKDVVKNQNLTESLKDQKTELALAKKNQEMTTLDFNIKEPSVPELSDKKQNDSSENRPQTINEDPHCPIKTSRYKDVLKCPHLSEAIKKLLRKFNYYYVKDDCEIESKTVNITSGKTFIAWTLIQTNSCENKAYPQGLSEEKTYQISDASEVLFGDHLELKSLEKYYLTHVDLKSATDEKGQPCSGPSEKNRGLNLGSLESDLTKAQFRFVDNTQKTVLQMQTFYQANRGRICSLRTDLANWKPYLFKDSIFQNKQKQNSIF